MTKPRCPPVRKLAAIIGVVLSVAAAGPAAGQSFPNKPVRLIVPFPAGSGAEQVYRVLLERMSAALGQTVLLEPKPGGNTLIGAQYVKAQPPDGYTIFVASNTITTQSLVPNAVMDIRKDFAPIVPTAYAALVLAVNAEQIPAKTLKELLDYARARPGQINYASYGIGSLGHLAMEVLLNEAGVKMEHIPFQGTAQAALETAAGRTQVTLSIPANINPYVAEGGNGKLRLLAVTTRERAPLTPQLPGMRESGFPDFDYHTWGGLFAPKGVSKEVVDKLNSATNEALRDPSTTTVYQRLGVWAVGGTPGDLTALINQEYNGFSKVIRERRLVIQ